MSPGRRRKTVDREYPVLCRGGRLPDDVSLAGNDGGTGVAEVLWEVMDASVYQFLLN